MANLQLVIFDMAGTTVQDNREVETCFMKAANATGLKVTEEEILAAQGWSKRFVFEKFWEKQLGQKGEQYLLNVNMSYDTFREILEHHYRHQPVRPARGAEEIFEFLKKEGIKIALTTGFYRKVADIILTKLGWLDGLDENYLGTADSKIQCSITSDEVEQGRPHPFMIYKAMRLLGVKDPQAVINIGDTPSDIQSGKRAGCRYSLAVGNGTHSAAQLSEHQPDEICKDLCAFQDFYTNFVINKN